MTKVNIYQNDLILCMSEVSVFNTKDIENIISWFERLYNSDEEISDYERETYLKLAKYFILDEKAMS